MNTKLLALDIYGTILSSTDADNQLPPRKGLLKLLDSCEELKIRAITTSDADLNDAIAVLKRIGLASRLESFELRGAPKEFGPIIAYYGIRPEELLVIGDSQEADINGAINIGARYLKVPKYIRPETRDLFDFIQVIALL